MYSQICIGREHEKQLFTGSNYRHNSLNGENETVLYRRYFVIYRCPFRHV